MRRSAGDLRRAPLLGLCLATAYAGIAFAMESRAGAQFPQGVPRCQLPDRSQLERRRAERDRIHVVGNREVNGRGQTWIPYGISIFGGLQDGDGNSAWRPTIPASLAQIEAAPFWHANAVRLQWAESNIFRDPTPGYAINLSFLQALCAQVQKIRRLGEVAVLNDNTEFPDWSEFYPTARTEQAWRIVIGEFGNQPGWIADLYNEPRLTLSAAHRKPTPANVDWLWRLWQRGGAFYSRHFVGMQQLVTYTRRVGFKGTEWIEEPFLQGLTQAWQYAIRDPLHNIAWTFHHAALPRDAAGGKTAEWRSDFGYLTHSYPVVDAEWNQAAAPLPECIATAYFAVGAYLRYLRALQVGLMVWSLQPGSMVAELPHRHRVETNITHRWSITNPKLLMRPSRMYPDYACDRAHVGEGAGQMVLSYFRRYSHG